jgi:hypothetical protein
MTIMRLLVFPKTLICFSLFCQAQTNMRGWHAAGQTWLVWEDI